MDRTSQFEIQLSNRTGAVFSGRPFFEQKGSFMAKKIIRLPRTKEQKQANRERNERANRTILSRTLILMVLCGVIAFVPLIGTLYNLMITQHDYYNEKAIKNQTRSTNLTAARGVIYDANMNVLASSSTVETVFIDPNEIAEQMKKPENSNLLDQIARGLGEILDVEPSFVYEQAADKQYRYKVISRKISEELADEVRAFISENKITGVYLETDLKRYYPNSYLAAQALGFVSSDNNGSEGLEAYYNEELSGTAGKVVTSKGNYGSEMPYTYEKYYDASDGCSLVTTIDTTVQAYVEKNLQNAIDKYDIKNGAFCIVMDVNTGEIKAMATLGVAPEKTAVISGIGCSSRLPYYMNTFGFHTIHGRAAAVATGFKVANPDITVWQISGDGDGLAIGGNHFIHAVRRNVDINMLLLNNKIYGLTKGQYSPTSPRGFVSKSSPYGTTEDPFIPAELVFGARGNFFARSIDVELQTTQEVLVAAARHKGASVVEILQNCMIFNNGTHAYVADREFRADRTIHLRHGEKMLFGKDMEKGLVQDGFLVKAVTIGQDGYTLDDVLVHDAHTPSNFLHQQLAMMDGLELPLAIGVIRDVDAPAYDAEVSAQVAEVRAKKGFSALRDMILAGDTWTVE